ncbi:MAG: molecular chaperone HtpG [Ignavibacteriales bacterium CG18_big_fil_WC_8_21_14_2_50_31_20]|nr:MAG: molecular chaperone HtpG [Ignavibacteriales bacterium CG18_big_fil_WC_8_21_14_2_50_31_20]
MSEEAKKENQFEFKAEIKELLNILVHSLYTNREIFIRELVSNASDALDKLRFESNRGTEIFNNDLELAISIKGDEKENLLTISDTGIGMTKDEIINHIGTIAKSGSGEFLKQLSESKEQANNIIGKFGVGFYSVFMVSDKVEIISRSFKADAKPIKWVSDGLGSFEVEEIDEDIKRGTEIRIHLKEDSKEYAEKYRLQNVIKSHSNFITFPIKVDEEQINTVTAVWREPKSSVKPEQYNEFYKFLSHDFEDPFHIIHKSVDAPIQFNALLFFPKKNMDLFGFNRDNYGLDLYVRRVLINHQNKDLLPEYLSFVKGVVDSEDLPLNISRETLQENVVFAKISSTVTKQILTELEKMAKDDKEKYAQFWKEFARIFKMGYADYSNQEKFVELLRFDSSANENKDQLVAFAEYVGRMKPDQKEIYYMTGPSRDALIMDPHLEIFKRKGIEVLYLYDPVDEFVISSINKYKEFELKSVDQVDLKSLEKLVDSGEKKAKAEELSKTDSKHLSSLLKKMKEILGDKVTDVKISERLEDSPACLVNSDNTMSASMQKMMNMMGNNTSIPAKILELNQDHKLVRNLVKIFKADSNDKYISDVTEQLYESSLLLEGYLQDPHKLVNRINSMLEESSKWYTEVKKLD